MIVAFLKGSIFTKGTRLGAKNLFEHDREFRKRAICLSRTGKLIYAAFGDELYDCIQWEDSDTVSIETLSRLHWPEIVLTLGAYACDAVTSALARSASYRPIHLYCHYLTKDLPAFAQRVSNL